MTVDTLKATESGQGISSPFREYVRLLRELHGLIAEGKGDSNEAEGLRDRMDDPWDQMSPEEIRRVRGLSADLYTLTDPPPPPRQLTQQELDEFERLQGAARSDKNWDWILDLLRDRPHPFPPDRVAFLRAGCWENLGDLETALLFLEKAVALSPDNADYRSAWMSTRSRLGRATDGITVGDRIIDHGESTPLDLTKNATAHVEQDAPQVQDRGDGTDGPCRDREGGDPSRGQHSRP